MTRAVHVHVHVNVDVNVDVDVNGFFFGRDMPHLLNPCGMPSVRNFRIDWLIMTRPRGRRAAGIAPMYWESRSL